MTFNLSDTHTVNAASGELDRLRAIARAVRAAGVGDLGQLQAALAELDKDGLAEFLDLLDGVREWTAGLLQVVEEHVAAHLDPVDEDLLHREVCHLADAGDLFAEIVTTLDPSRPRRVDPELTDVT